MTTLSARHLLKRFRAAEVIKDVSLIFHPGTVTSIVGDNGAGKSTLLKILSGFHEPDGGGVLLGEQALTEASPSARRRAGIEMVYQNLALAVNHDIVANLFLGRERSSRIGRLLRGEMEERSVQILEQLGIELPELRTPVGLLSGGQQQAVAIARALLFDPRVLLLDEPTAALAAREVERVLEIIRRQKAAGRIVVLVSHRLNDIFAVSDRIVVLKRGSVFSEDPIGALTMAEVVHRIVS